MFRRCSAISEQHPRHRAVLDGVSVRRRFTASSFRFWGSATSGRLGRVTVLPQLKVDRLCSIVDDTADFEPKETFAWRRGLLRSGFPQRATDVGPIRLNSGSTAEEDGVTDQSSNVALDIE